MRTVDRAKGRWRNILPQLGIESRFLVNKHGPCPLCGGKDRFRWDDRDGSGSYYCNQCGPGPGLLLIQKLNGWNYAKACAAVDEIIGTDAPRLAPKQACERDRSEWRLANLKRVVAAATDGGIISDYIHRRGLHAVPEPLRGHSALAYYGADRQLVGYFPAMVAPVIGPDGKLESLLRTYITGAPKGENKKLMTPVHTVKGAAVRLFEPADTLGVAEGIETAIAAHELFDVPTWAALTAGGLESFRPPDAIRHLHIFADNDTSFTGQKAAFVLAHRLRRERSELRIEVYIPNVQDTDWRDVLAPGVP